MIKISGVLQKKSLKMSKNKKRRINTQRQVTNKAMKKPIVTRYTAVMFARLRSNRWYKPGD